MIPEWVENVLYPILYLQDGPLTSIIGVRGWIPARTEVRIQTIMTGLTAKSIDGREGRYWLEEVRYVACTLRLR